MSPCSSPSGRGETNPLCLFSLTGPAIISHFDPNSDSAHPDLMFRFRFRFRFKFKFRFSLPWSYVQALPWPETSSSSPASVLLGCSFIKTLKSKLWILDKNSGQQATCRPGTSTVSSRYTCNMSETLEDLYSINEYYTSAVSLLRTLYLILIFR